jgi:hypothetical protein
MPNQRAVSKDRFHGQRLSGNLIGGILSRKKRHWHGDRNNG